MNNAQAGQMADSDCSMHIAPWGSVTLATSSQSAHGGVVLNNLDPECALAKGSLKDGDVVIGVGGDRAATIKEFVHLLEHKRGPKVCFVIRRNGELGCLPVDLPLPIWWRW